MNVQIWSPGNPLVASTVICHTINANALRDHIAKEGADVKAYEVTPNGADYLDLLISFLSFQANKDWVPNRASSVNVDVAWIVRNMQRLAFALTNWDDKAASNAITFLLKHETALHPQQVRFIRFCGGLVEKIIRRFLWGSPATMSWPPSSSARLWWKLSSDLAQEAKNQIVDFKNVFHGKVPPAVHGVSIWLSQFHARLGSNLFGVARQDAMMEASALCAAQAAIHHSHGRCSLTVLFCHRAVDLMFTAICADRNLVDFTKAGGEGELKAAVNGQTSLSLMNCHDALVHASIILPNSSRQTLLFNLNLTRNRLLLTHGMGSPTDAETKACLVAVINVLKSQGGPTWQAAYSHYRSGFSLTVTALFELSDGLMQTLQEL